MEEIEEGGGGAPAKRNRTNKSIGRNALVERKREREMQNRAAEGLLRRKRRERERYTQNHITSKVRGKRIPTGVMCQSEKKKSCKII